jgi:hypothetical protein
MASHYDTLPPANPFILRPGSKFVGRRFVPVLLMVLALIGLALVYVHA